MGGSTDEVIVSEGRTFRVVREELGERTGDRVLVTDDGRRWTPGTNGSTGTVIGTLYEEHE